MQGPWTKRAYWKRREAILSYNQKYGVFRRDIGGITVVVLWHLLKPLYMRFLSCGFAIDSSSYSGKVSAQGTTYVRHGVLAMFGLMIQVVKWVCSSLSDESRPCELSLIWGLEVLKWLGYKASPYIENQNVGSWCWCGFLGPRYKLPESSGPTGLLPLPCWPEPRRHRWMGPFRNVGVSSLASWAHCSSQDSARPRACLFSVGPPHMNADLPWPCGLALATEHAKQSKPCLTNKLTCRFR